MEKELPLSPALEERVPVELFKGEVVAWAERIGMPAATTVASLSPIVRFHRPDASELESNSVQKEQRAESLVLGGGGDVSIHGQVGEKCLDLVRPPPIGLVFFDVLVYTAEETFCTRCLAEVSALYG